MIIKALVLGMFGTNCYIVGSEATGEGIIIDPGDEARTILQTVKSMGLNVKLIAITHGHMDHTGALEDIRRATGAPVVIHRDDADVLMRIGTNDRLLNGGETIKVGDLNFTVIHTPGHSPGGICLYGNGVLFCGDTLFNLSIGRTDIGGNYNQLINSIVSKLMILPDDTVVYPGHGPETTIGTERRSNPFLR